MGHVTALQGYLLLAALLFAIGLAGALTRRNAILVLIGIELMLNAAAGVLNEPIHHEEVMEMGRRVERQFTGLLTALVPQIVAAN